MLHNKAVLCINRESPFFTFSNGFDKKINQNNVIFCLTCYNLKNYIYKVSSELVSGILAFINL